MRKFSHTQLGFTKEHRDPQIGRWWQHDPMMQYANPYLAMGNNPALLTDPSGLWDGGPGKGTPEQPIIAKPLHEFVAHANPTSTDAPQWFEYGNPFRVQSDEPGGSMDGIFLGLSFKNTFDPQRPRQSSNSINYQQNNEYLWLKMYLHYQFGQRTPFILPASSINLHGLTQRDLDLEKTKRGYQEMNLYTKNLGSKYGMAFGKLAFKQLAKTNFFKIDNNRFDFDYQKDGTMARNAGTLFGGLLFGQIYETPISTIFPPSVYPLSYLTLQPHLDHGGSYDVIFD